jgi:anti-anti-sigma factor
MPKRTVHVSLQGDLDFFYQSTLNAALPNPADAESIVIDLLRVTYVDSLAVGRFVKYRNEFIDAGGNAKNFVIILPKSGTVRRIFEITGLLRIFATAEAAVEDSESA